MTEHSSSGIPSPILLFHQAHAKFDDDKSEFTGYLKLWRWLVNWGQVPMNPGGSGDVDNWNLTPINLLGIVVALHYAPPPLALSWSAR